MSERDLFNAALAIQGDAARQAYLESACGGDPALRRRVEPLLRAHDGASRFLERPASPGLAHDDGTWGRTDWFGPRGEGQDGGETRDDGDEDEPPLDFLLASERPGS